MYSWLPRCRMMLSDVESRPSMFRVSPRVCQDRAFSSLGNNPLKNKEKEKRRVRVEERRGL